ncbi:MAG: lipoate--protein ligase [Clostridia bacterium]|nr:lipoate--protein ligase [Clostridia bacterium]
MILIRTDCYDLAWNLALEYYFSMEKKLGDTVFVLWQADPTVIIGKYQNLRAEVNLAYTEANNIRIVRRLSGGGAVYADRGNVMYTFLEPAGEEISFAPYLSRMQTALRSLGYPAEISGRNDLLAEGRKFSGNSQYIREGMCVHHGTLLYDSDLSVLERATTPSKEKLATKGIRSVRERVCNLREFTPGRTVEEFVDALADACAGGAERYVLTEEDRRRIDALADELFRGEETLTGRDPVSTLSRARRFAGGELRADLDLKAGILRSVTFSGDVFGDADALAARLAGIPFTAEAVAAAVKSSPFPGVTREELLELLRP